MLIIHISTFSPTPCGIATYAEALIQNYLGAIHEKVRLLYHCDQKDAGTFLDLRIEERDAYSIIAAAINASDADIVSLQHEFSIFGGRDGEYILDLINKIEKPIISTLHTTPMFMSLNQARIIKDIVRQSSQVVVLTEQAKSNVAQIVGDATKLNVVRHGIQDVEFRVPGETPLRRRLGHEHVFLSAGHVSDRKGYTNTLAAMAQLRAAHIEFLYVILGAHQPQFGVNSQCVYSLKRMIRDCDLYKNVIFEESYNDLDVLLEYIMAADLGIVAYTDCQQSSSGMIPMILGCGRPVIATPFEYAVSTARMKPGLYISHGYQAEHISQSLRAVIETKNAITETMPTIYESTRPWLWRNAAGAYEKLVGDVQVTHKAETFN